MKREAIVLENLMNDKKEVNVIGMMRQQFFIECPILILRRNHFAIKDKNTHLNPCPVVWMV
jgi:hypothetical protein